MRLKLSSGKPMRVYPITREMYDLLVSQSIPLSDLSKISTYHQKLTASEIALILKFQQIVWETMGVKFVQELATDDYQAGLVAKALDDLNSESLASRYKECKRYSYVAPSNDIVAVIFEKDVHAAGTTPLSNGTFSGALLETLFAKVGYMDVHYGKIVNPVSGEFSMAEVYKLLSLENP